MQVGWELRRERDVYSRCKSGRAYTSTRWLHDVAGSIANETQSSRNDDTAIGLLLVKQGVVPDGRDVRAREPPHGGRYPSWAESRRDGFVSFGFLPPGARADAPPIIDTRNHSPVAACVPLREIKNLSFANCYLILDPKVKKKKKKTKKEDVFLVHWFLLLCLPSWNVKWNWNV